jgi:hypothetical protein
VRSELAQLAEDPELPGLAVQAQYGSSFPILRRLGFVETATVHTIRSLATGY